MAQLTVANDSTPQTSVGTTFNWSGTEYLYVQADSASKSDFATLKNIYVWTDDKIIDAEKDSLTIENYYLYLNSCWAATAANMFVNAGWAEGVFADEDVALKYFVENFSKKTDPSGYVYVDGGLIEFGVEYLLGGYYDYWETVYTDLTHPEKTSSGGFYREATRGKMSDYLTAYMLYETEPNYQQYTPETGNYSEYISTSQPESVWMDQAVAALKDGSSVGLMVMFYNSDYSICNGGHALTVYGFTYDESKAGTPYYYTGVIVADPDDNKGSPTKLNGIPASQSPDRMKILNIEYDESQQVYILPTYDYNINNVNYFGVIYGFEYLIRRPDDLVCTVNSEVVFAEDPDWNAAYSVSATRENAVIGNKGVITAKDNVYIAVNLRNAGVGKSGSFTITATIDGDDANALTFTIDKILAYGESDSQTVIDLGKLSQGTHKISLVVADGTYNSSLDIDQLYISEASETANQIIVNSGETDSDTTVAADYSMIVKSGGAALGTIIAADGTMIVEKGGSSSDAEVSASGVLIANGSVDRATIKADGTLFAENGATAQNTTIEADGWMEINYQGNAGNSSVYGEMVVINGSAVKTTVYANGTLAVVDNGVATDSKIQSDGGQYVTEGGLAVNNTFDGSRQDISDGGIARNNTLNNQSRQDISDGGIADKTTLNNGSIQSLRQAQAYDTSINAGSIAYVYDSGISIDCTVEAGGKIILGDSDSAGESKGAGAVKNLTVKHGGLAVLGDGSVLYGKNSVAGTLTVQGSISGSALNRQDAAPVMVFDFSARSAEDGCMVNDISLISDLDYQLVFDDAQSNGVYKLTDNGGNDFNESIRVYDDEGVFYGTLTQADIVLMNDQIVTLENSAGALNFVVADSPYQEFEIPQTLVHTGSSSCSWAHIARSSGYLIQFSRDNFETFITVNMTENAFNLNNLPYDLQWRVKTLESNVWTCGENIEANIQNDDGLIHANKDWGFDVLFARSSTEWASGYCARHLGTVGVWAGTGERVSLVGKNKLGDIFEGSSDANILLLTDDACGDALFVDDIHTAFPKTAAELQSRIAQIDEIRAGAGDDIIDMTSQRFVYDGRELTIRGGDGDDVIWATGSGNKLFGDAGDDRIVGGEGLDLIVGGAGDDVLHGGGGEDTFCFGGNWGNDTVEQLEGGKITLWFKSGKESNWDDSTLTYTDGANSVIVSGISKDNITLIFGDDTSLLYDELAAAGCFDDAVSKKIFEDENKGMLA